MNFACFVLLSTLQRLKTCSLPDLRMLFEAAATTGHVDSSVGAQLVKDEEDAEEDGDEEDADSDDGNDDELDEVDAEEIVNMEDDDDEEEEEELNVERLVEKLCSNYPWFVPEWGGREQTHGNLTSLSSIWDFGIRVGPLGDHLT